ncbi:amidase family protein [Marinoscillum pacificum]|uniref:amidase family protein n=1 Tax=Marinoscillum pacificum TaxID=392723 RepID=UPI002157A798|nr:amidase family protein [Marinoscillum pacificum]
MYKKFLPILLITGLACKQEPKTIIDPWVPYDQSSEIAANADHESTRMQYKLIQSRVSDKNDLWSQIGPQITYFGSEDYEALKPLILDQDIPTLQSHVKSGKLTYEKLTQWYLYRIVKFENDSASYLNNLLAINPNAVAEAKKCDANKSDDDHPLYGMPVLLKDNINFAGLPTTAGTYLLRGNDAADAFIVDRIQDKGGIILGKTSLSEWANFLCLGCPNGYNAVGGQTLNPYGRKIFDTGGSSSGSGSAIAANYAVAAIGTETSGSILSPSSQSSLAGLKPTTGRLSRSGIVPLSSTLDTPGPMTKSVIDNAIFMSALTGEDTTDPATVDNPDTPTYWEDVQSGTLEGKRFGVNKQYLEDSIYALTVKKIEDHGGIMVEFDPAEMDWTGFGELLNADMRVDLPAYLNQYAPDSITARTIEEIVAYNYEDSTLRIPYGQGRFERILETNLSEAGVDSLRTNLRAAGQGFFEAAFEPNDLDFVLSINNWNAGHAAAANYPCLTIPMGYKESGEPIGLTFISRPFEEDQLLKVAYAFEQATQARKMPEAYQ